MKPVSSRSAAPLPSLRVLLRTALALLLAILTGGGQPALAALPPDGSAAALPGASAGAIDGFARAIGPRAWRFPADFGAHPEFQNEWWYTTGNLETPDGRPFGYELTLFRQALPLAEPESESEPVGRQEGPSSAWRSSQIYSAHFSISDIQSDRFQHEERFSRGSLGLAGARGEPYEVWLNDWRLETDPDDASVVKLSATSPEMAIDLRLRQSRGPVLQGERGLSRKGPDPGNASYYYSQVQQPSEGTIRLGSRSWPVSGVSWTDHEFFTRSLGPGTVGWDWFALQFDDGSALMLSDTRGDDGTGGGSAWISGGRWIEGERETELTAQDIRLEVTDHWRSPRNGALYPAGWQLSVPRLDLTLRLRPLMADQELTTAAATYWEGALGVSGRRGERKLTGRGYGELTGYAGRIDASLAAAGDRDPSPS